MDDQLDLEEAENFDGIDVITRHELLEQIKKLNTELTFVRENLKKLFEIYREKNTKNTELTKKKYSEFFALKDHLLDLYCMELLTIKEIELNVTEILK